MENQRHLASERIHSLGLGVTRCLECHGCEFIGVPDVKWPRAEKSRRTYLNYHMPNWPQQGLSRCLPHETHVSTSPGYQSYLALSRVLIFNNCLEF